MNIEDLKKLSAEAESGLTSSRAALAVLDDQIAQLRAQRTQVIAQIQQTMGAIRFAQLAAEVEQSKQPKTSPALERAKEALAAAEPGSLAMVGQDDLAALIRHTTGTVAP